MRTWLVYFRLMCPITIILFLRLKKLIFIYYYNLMFKKSEEDDRLHPSGTGESGYQLFSFK